MGNIIHTNYGRVLPVPFFFFFFLYKFVTLTNDVADPSVAVRLTLADIRLDTQGRDLGFKFLKGVAQSILSCLKGGEACLEFQTCDFPIV